MKNNELEKSVKSLAKEIEGLYQSTGKAVPRGELIAILQLHELRKLNSFLYSKEEEQLQRKLDFFRVK